MVVVIGWSVGLVINKARLVSAELIDGSVRNNCLEEYYRKFGDDFQENAQKKMWLAGLPLHRCFGGANIQHRPPGGVHARGM